MIAKFAALALLACGQAMATPGGIDSYGCHKSKVAGYHCHDQKLEKIRGYTPGESMEARGRRLSAQCINLPNEGVCYGYAPLR